MRYHFSTALFLTLSCCSFAEGPRLNQVQCIGSHNSYHIAPDAFTKKLIGTVSGGDAQNIDYTHPPLTDQLERMGLRQFELDLYADPKGGRYAAPLALTMAEKAGEKLAPHDPDGKLKSPGVKIIHNPDFDFRTRALTLRDALTEFKTWSDAHPSHFPVFLLLELKASSYSPATRPPAWDETALDAMEKEILSVLPRERLLTPDDVRGSLPTVREAVEHHGWPELSGLRGRFVLLLDNEGAEREIYLKRSEILAGRLLFVSVARTHPAAAFMKRNDAKGSAKEISELVRDGFLVRTRADANMKEARSLDFSTRDAALASGAQLVSTDFAEEDKRFPGYRVTLGTDIIARSNPVCGIPGWEERRGGK